MKAPQPVNASGQALQQLVDKIERLEGEKKDLADDIKEVYGEAKSHGFDTKILKKIISLRKLDVSERQEQEELIDVYMHALGMV